MLVWFLAGGVGVSVLFWCGCKVGREWQRQSAAVDTIAKGTAEYRFLFHGGPYDGAHINTTPRVGQPLVQRAHVMVANGGAYVLTGSVVMPDGGAVLQCEWSSEVAA